MRGTFVDQGGLFSYIAPEARVPANHPLRKIRELVRDVLGELTRSLGRLYASEGRPSIPPEQLLSALLLQVFYGIRSERQLMEQLDYNLLYRWFVGLSPDAPIWDPTTFTKNRDRLQTGAVFAKFMSKLLNHPEVKPLLSDEHFSVDGTLIEAWASHKSFRPKDGSGDDDGGADFHGQQRKNDTHASHAARRLWHVAIVSSDDRMHLRLGQAARHDAQDQTSWPSQRLYRLHAQSDRLQPDPHSQTADGLGQRLFTTSRPPQNPRQKDGQCTNLQVLPQTVSRGGPVPLVPEATPATTTTRNTSRLSPQHH